MSKVLFLDLDGTVRLFIPHKSSSPYDPYNQIIYPNVHNLLDAYKANDWIIIGITNQKGVISGYKTQEELVTELRYTLDLLPHFLSIYACIDDGNTCIVVRKNMPTLTYLSTLPIYRKPFSGMLYQALEAYGLFKSERYLYVGDRAEDASCAASMNIPFIHAVDWRLSDQIVM